MTEDADAFIEPELITGFADDGDWQDEGEYWGDKGWDHQLHQYGKTIRQAEGQNRDEFIASLHDQFVDVVMASDGMIESVKGASYTWDLIMGSLDQHGPLFEPGTSSNDVRAARLSLLVGAFIKDTDALLIDHVLQAGDANETLGLLADPFLNYFSVKYWQRHEDGPALDQEAAFFACLELVVQAAGTGHQECGDLRSGLSGSHIESVGMRLKDKFKEANQMRYETMVEAAEEIHDERKGDYRSRTRDEEGDRSLSPMSKRQIFMNRVREFNHPGVMVKTVAVDVDGRFVAMGLKYHPLVIVKRGDEERVEQFFIEHPECSAETLLKYLHACLRVKREQLEGRHHHHSTYFSDKGNIISFLLKHTDKIGDEIAALFSYNVARW